MSWAPSRKIGGGDIPKLLGISNYGNAADVYLRIVEEIDDEWNPRMERGAAVEPVLRAHGQRMYGLELEDRDSDRHEHPEHVFGWAQIDDLARWNGLPVVVDYKSQNAFVRGWGPDGSDVVPEHLRAQLTWELACADRELGLLVVGFGEDVDGPAIFNITNICHYPVERDRRFESLCVQVAKEFWFGNVIPRRPPNVKPLGEKAKAS